MLRITTHDTTEIITLLLEGKLAGPWVEVLRECWQQQLNRAGGRGMHVDLRAVTFVDAAGKALLAEMCSRNSQFFARDCQMKAILAEVRHSSNESV